MARSKSQERRDDASPELREQIRSVLIPLSVSPRLVRMLGADTAVFLAGLKEIMNTEDDHARYADDKLARDIQARYEAHPGWQRYDPKQVEQYTGLRQDFQEAIVQSLQESRLLQYRQLDDGQKMVRIMTGGSL